jgi:hypothetical protein
MDNIDLNTIDEKEVQEMLHENMELVACVYCGKIISLFSCWFDDGNPVCRGGCYG